MNGGYKDYGASAASACSVTVATITVTHHMPDTSENYSGIVYPARRWRPSLPSRTLSMLKRSLARAIESSTSGVASRLRCIVHLVHVLGVRITSSVVVHYVSMLVVTDSLNT